MLEIYSYIKWHKISFELQELLLLFQPYITWLMAKVWKAF